MKVIATSQKTSAHVLKLAASSLDGIKRYQSICFIVVHILSLPCAAPAHCWKVRNQQKVLNGYGKGRKRLPDSFNVQ